MNYLLLVLNDYDIKSIQYRLTEDELTITSAIDTDGMETDEYSTDDIHDALLHHLKKSYDLSEVVSYQAEALVLGDAIATITHHLITVSELEGIVN